MNFKEKKTWNLMGICGISILIATFILFIFVSFVPNRMNELGIKETVLHLLMFFLFAGILCMALGRSTIKESVPIEYKLKEPLEISINYGFKPELNNYEDPNGLKIFNDRDYEKMVEHIAFKKGDVIKIKTIGEYDIATNKTKKQNWRSAGVYMIFEDKLVELSYDDIKKQEIDKLLISMYNEK